MAQSAKDRIRFACDECDQLLSIGAGRIGQTVTCPKCGCKNVVPPAEAAAAQLDERKKRKQTRREESHEDFSQFEVYDDETEFIFETEEGEGYYGGKVDRNKVAVPRSILYMQGGLLGFVALSAFAFGWLVGAMTSGPAHSPTEDNSPKVVRGTVTFEDSSGRPQPDADSVVILLPQDNRPASGEKIEVEGLRPIDAPPDENHPSLQQIHTLGGAYARTNHEGVYRLQVPKRGRYYMLVISGNAQRSGSDEPNRDHLAKMGAYFVGVLDLFGQNRFEWSEEEIGRDVTRDLEFGES